MLREAEIALSQGLTVGQICRQLSISEQSYYRWHKQYGGLKVSQVKRIKDIERENSRLKKTIADLTLDNVILKEALEGNYTLLLYFPHSCLQPSRHPIDRIQIVT